MSIGELVEPLPYALQEQVSGYSRAVSTRMQDIFQDAQLKYDHELAEKFLFVATVRKLWSIVDGNYWLLQNSLNLLGSSVHGISYGRTIYSREADSVSELEELRDALLTLITDLGLDRYVQLPSLRDILTAIRGQN